MKEFNLEQAKSGAPLIQRNGGDAKVIGYDNDNKEFPLVIKYSFILNKQTFIEVARLDGTSKVSKDFDLSMKIIKKRRLYKSLSTMYY